MLFFDLFEKFFVFGKMLVSFRVEIEHVVKIFDYPFLHLIFNFFPGSPGRDKADLSLNHVYHHLATESLLEAKNGRYRKLIKNNFPFLPI